MMARPRLKPRRHNRIRSRLKAGLIGLRNSRHELIRFKLDNERETGGMGRTAERW